MFIRTDLLFWTEKILPGHPYLFFLTFISYEIEYQVERTHPERMGPDSHMEPETI